MNLEKVEVILKDYQAVLLDLLKELDRVCKAANIEYFLIYGTLLGAVRHKGFIPWDNDVDVTMKISDYERFKKMAPGLIGSDFFLSTPEGEPELHGTFTKLRKNHTTFLNYYNEHLNVHKGIGIDIYPLFNIADNPVQRGLQFMNAAMYMLFQTEQAPKNHGKLVHLGSQVLLGLFRGGLRMKMKLHCHRKMAAHEGRRTQFKACLAGNMSGARNLMPSEHFDRAIMLSFEDGVFPAPQASEKILEKLYGDYMKLPPMEMRQAKWVNVLRISTVD